MKKCYSSLPHGGNSCQDNFTLLWFQSQMDSFISFDLKNIVNDVMDGVELDDVKLLYLDNMQKTTPHKTFDTIMVSAKSQKSRYVDETQTFAEIQIS